MKLPTTSMKSDHQKPSSRRLACTLSTFFFVVVLCMWFSIKEVQLEALRKVGQAAVSNFSKYRLTNNSSLLNSTSPAPDMKILIGILTLPDNDQRRHFLRMIYGTQSTDGAQVDVRFVFCNITKEDQKVLVALEIMQYDDIIILNCQENMDRGKTFTYFSSLPEIFKDEPYDYVMKADDDTFFRLEKLVASLRPLPTEDLYYGYVVPCPAMETATHYMAGMGYLVSWDIVEWIRSSEIPRNHTSGCEDLVFGDWLRDGHKAKNRHNAKWGMYDIPDPPTACSHEFWPGTIAVHKLKNQVKWIRTLEYFNFTKDLKPSKLYHIP
ncbi:hypothetical protein ACHQM5_030153 [Ranunculus cassubicifolius]